YSEYEKWGVGVNARQDIGNDFSVGSVIDYVFRTNHSIWVGEADLQYEKPFAKQRLLGWVGVGAGVLRDDTQNDELPPEWDAIASGYVGVGLHGKPYMPYLEMRCLSHGNFHGLLYLGFRF